MQLVLRAGKHAPSASAGKYATDADGRKMQKAGARNYCQARENMQPAHSAQK